MDKILLTSSLSCLKDYHEKLSYSHWEYLCNNDNPYTKVIRDVIFKNVPCWKELTVNSWLFDLVEYQYIAWVWNPETDKELVNIQNFTKGYLVWMIAAEYSLNGTEPQVEFITPDEVIYENWVYSRVIFFSKSMYTMMWEEIKHFCYKRTYNVWKTINELFETNWQWSLEGTKKTDFSIIPELVWIPEEEDTWLTTPALYVEQFDAPIDSYSKNIHSIDRKMSAADKEMQKIVKSRVLVMWAKDPKKNVINDNDVWEWEIGWDIKQIVETNENLSIMLEFIKEQKRQISWVMSIPFSDMWLEDAWTGTGEKAMVVKNAQFRQKMDSVRWMLIKAVQYFIPDFEARFTDLNINDEETEINNITIALDAWLTTKIKAVARYNNISEDKAKELLNEINLQNNPE